MEASHGSLPVLSDSFLARPSDLPRRGAFGGTADGSEKIYPDAEIFVTATRIEWLAAKTAGFVTVATKNPMRATRAESVAEALHNVPSLTVVRSWSRSKVTHLFIWGAASNRPLSTDRSRSPG